MLLPLSLNIENRVSFTDTLSGRAVPSPSRPDCFSQRSSEDFKPFFQIGSGLPGRTRLVRRPSSVSPKTSPHSAPARTPAACRGRDGVSLEAEADRRRTSPGCKVSRFGWVKLLCSGSSSTGADRVKTGRNAGKSNKNLGGHGVHR
jgi:hypothetical protein